MKHNNNRKDEKHSINGGTNNTSKSSESCINTIEKGGNIVNRTTGSIGTSRSTITGSSNDKKGNTHRSLLQKLLHRRVEDKGDNNDYVVDYNDNNDTTTIEPKTLKTSKSNPKDNSNSNSNNNTFRRNGIHRQLHTIPDTSLQKVMTTNISEEDLNSSHNNNIDSANVNASEDEIEITTMTAEQNHDTLMDVTDTTASTSFSSDSGTDQLVECHYNDNHNHNNHNLTAAAAAGPCLDLDNDNDNYNDQTKDDIKSSSIINNQYSTSKRERRLLQKSKRQHHKQQHLHDYVHQTKPKSPSINENSQLLLTTAVAATPKSTSATFYHPLILLETKRLQQPNEVFLLYDDDSKQQRCKISILDILHTANDVIKTLFRFIYYTVSSREHQSILLSSLSSISITTNFFLLLQQHQQDQNGNAAFWSSPTAVIAYIFIVLAILVQRFVLLHGLSILFLLHGYPVLYKWIDYHLTLPSNVVAYKHFKWYWNRFYTSCIRFTTSGRISYELIGTATFVQDFLASNQPDSTSYIRWIIRYRMKHVNYQLIDAINDSQYRYESINDRISNYATGYYYYHQYHHNLHQQQQKQQQPKKQKQVQNKK